MTADLSTTLTRLRHKAERASVLPRDSFKPAFLEAMGVIEQHQAEIERLLQAVAAGGIKAGELTARLVEREGRIKKLGDALCEQVILKMAKSGTIYDISPADYAKRKPLAWDAAAKACKASNLEIPFKEDQ